MAEYRQDPTTGEWIIVAPERGGRPGADRSPPAPVGAGDAGKAQCPFCPGNEHLLGPIVQEWSSEGPPGWAQRAVSNLYPVAREAGDGESLNAVQGRHEVLVESPDHTADLAAMPPGELAQVLAANQQRLCKLQQIAGVRFVSLFRNRGGTAGASLSHPHAQLIALDMLPPRIDRIDSWLAAREAGCGGCPLCEMLAKEGEGGRMVARDEGFITLVPYAPGGPCEQMIVPRRHSASFANATEEELHELASTLGNALRRLDSALDGPPYNLLFESAPPSLVHKPYWHWHLRLAPRLTRPGGFERSAGMAIVPSLPDDDAAKLRAANAPIEGEMQS